MARNLLGAGFDLSVYNRTAEKCDALVAAGAERCGSAAEVGERSGVVVTMVSDTPDVEAVLFGGNGLAGGLKPGSVVIDMSTISPAATVDFARRLGEQSVEMLDAPVSGGESGAIEGTLSIMAGGKREVFDRCLALFEAMGKNIVYTGPNGNGQKTKLVNQIVGSITLVAMAEGLRVAEKAGLPMEETLKAVSAGAAGSWMLSHLGPKVLAGDFDPGFSIRLHQKDLRLAAEFVKDLKVRAPGTQLSYELFTEALDKGMGELGNQGLYKVWD